MPVVHAALMSENAVLASRCGVLEEQQLANAETVERLKACAVGCLRPALHAAAVSLDSHMCLNVKLIKYSALAL